MSAAIICVTSLPSHPFFQWDTVSRKTDQNRVKCVARVSICVATSCFSFLPTSSPSRMSQSRHVSPTNTMKMVRLHDI